MVKKISAVHVGRLDAKILGLDNGSIFTISLPLCAKEEELDEPVLSNTAALENVLVHLMINDDNLDATP